MLPKSLLLVQKRKGQIRPRYLTDHPLVLELIHLFERHQGHLFKELQDAIRALEGPQFKLVRGLSTLLERRCNFHSNSPLDVLGLRTFLFEHGPAISEQQRAEVLQMAANAFGVSPSEIDAAMFTDLPEAQTLTQFTPLPAIELIQEYNLALTQTLLFDALSLDCTLSSNYQPFMRQVKYLGLMYTIDQSINITGPASLFKQTKKYGNAFAKLFPTILPSDHWELTAQIAIKVAEEPRILQFHLSSDDAVPFPPAQSPRTAFDSAVEAQFYQDFKALKTRWEIRREPEILKAGTFAVIPDFGFYLGDLSHFLEIVGFWTPQYLQHKIAKLRVIEVPITLAVDQTLNCTSEDFSGTVIFYDKKVPLSPIVQILHKLEEKRIAQELETLPPITLTEDIVSLESQARALNVSPEALRRASIPNYHLVGDQLVSQAFLHYLQTCLAPHQPYSQVESLLQEHQLSTAVLKLLGYQILWKGLTPVKIIKKRPKKLP